MVMSNSTSTTAHGGTNLDPIGTCFMDSDRSLILRLRAIDDSDMILGHAQLRYPMGHFFYSQLLEHVGSMYPGTTKLVMPWPE